MPDSPNEPVVPLPTEDDPDVRDEVRRVQEGHRDAGPSAGVVTEELKNASTTPPE
jgi:hypothetical protein